MLGTKSGGQKGFDVFGSGLATASSGAPSEMPATVLSSVSMSSVLMFIVVVGGIVLYRQSTDIKAKLAKKIGELFVALRKRRAAKNKRGTRPKSTRPEEKAVDAWVAQPLASVTYEKTEYLIILGEVLGEYATLDEAKAACNANDAATHIQHSLTTGRAAVKTMVAWPEEFFMNGGKVFDPRDPGNVWDDGRPVRDNLNDFNKFEMKWGEGWHGGYVTYYHPRFFLLKVVADTGEEVSLTMDDLWKYRNAIGLTKKEMNDSCRFGGKGQCIWNTLGKYIMLVAVDALLNIATAFTGGSSLLLRVGWEVAQIGAEAGVIAYDISSAAKTSAFYRDIAKRYDGLKKGIHASCIYLGGPEDADSYFMQQLRTDCANNDMVRGQDLKARLNAFEALPEAPWNCDEITSNLRLSWGLNGGSNFMCLPSKDNAPDNDGVIQGS